MNILTKFDNIKIENDRRIAAEDADFCKREQNIYEKVAENYITMYGKMQKLKELENRLTDEIPQEITSKEYRHIFIDMNDCDFAKIMLELHEKFISHIYSYFERKYGINIEYNEDKIVIVRPPEKQEFYFLNWCRPTNEELIEHKRRKEEYNTAMEKYYQDMINFRVDYNTVIDDIFIQLDGFSFDDKARQEIIDGCKTNNVELKKGKIVFDILHSYRYGSWDTYQISLDSSIYKGILRALTFYDSDERQKDIYSGWVKHFVGYSKNESDGIYDTHQTVGHKVDTFKYYKNGKWEVKFKTADQAQEFYQMYCM